MVKEMLSPYSGALQLPSVPMYSEYYKPPLDYNYDVYSSILPPVYCPYNPQVAPAFPLDDEGPGYAISPHCNMRADEGDKEGASMETNGHFDGGEG
jgi:hypothetical protein